jgi:hypothetical protein
MPPLDKALEFRYTDRRGSAHLFLGAGTLLLFAIIIFLIIAAASPETGNQITGNLAALSNAAQGITP